MKPKIFLYLEYRSLGIGGAASSYKYQKKMLEMLGIPYAETWAKDATIFQSNSPWLKSLYYIFKARAKGMKVIVWGHSTAEDVHGFFRSRLLDRFAVFLMRHYFKFVYSRADVVLCPTPYTLKLLLDYGVPREKLQVQSNGVDTVFFRSDEKLRQTARAAYGLSGIAVGTVAIAIPRKGVSTFLALSKRFPEQKFIWYGKLFSGALVTPLPPVLPANVKFAGHIPDILAGFNSLDIFLFPSLEENQGMAILEAAAVGLPIIVRDIPVYEGWLKHEDNCLKARTEEEFADCLERLLKDERLRARLSSNARLLAVEESLPKLAERFAETYSRLLAGTSSDA